MPRKPLDNVLMAVVAAVIVALALCGFNVVKIPSGAEWYTWGGPLVPFVQILIIVGIPTFFLTQLAEMVKLHPPAKDLAASSLFSILVAIIQILILGAIGIVTVPYAEFFGMKATWVQIQTVVGITLLFFLSNLLSAVITETQ